MGVMMDIRYSFTAQFLCGSAFFAAQARSLEETNPEAASQDVIEQHRAFVVGAIVQCAAALEAEITEIVQHGPGHHLGSNGIDADAHAYLVKLSEVLDRTSTLKKYEAVLHLLRRPPMDLGTMIYERAELLISLRNELIHYESKWDSKIKGQKLFQRLERLRFEKPPFTSSTSNFFPHHCLSASLASWSVTTAVNFIDTFHDHLNIPSPLKSYKEQGRLAVPSLIHKH